ncbi:septum formation initiator family protein [Mycobacterium sp. CBMA293]|uniref:FtsB family cell division protein n=1 Tax=unclassified Mycolicibacterium TaxID=2636767 RepID=UPI0012DEAC94|nr:MULTISPECIES: septum formation initiator family protein [unclassified Mycolicibacterium]MUL49579.1 septum formation initiator family protein [Mycolicibacterium sp. CBMA 360]MUL61675.1 septum formation initiator family protein [Mycolicibacterium sp. CBMA 335]MUL74411.1 septum formation initiator family protein [Mycolicibacterium sp. CBMA 311]MUL96688.1 septum formation initiator family protein [Mycolicibacterium sp. CBMA 230]MUM04151.1 septum formation initiator [Mycolicibacterium sp. CBMA 2
MADPKRRTPASRPAKPGEAKRGRAASATAKAGNRPKADPRRSPDNLPVPVTEPIRQAYEESVEHHAEQRLGSAARRAAILAVVVCILTLTIAGPVRTYFAQRTEMQQLSTAEAQLRSQISNLEQQKVKLADPVYIAAQARERLGFVMPGDIPYQVQLPPGAVTAPVAPAPSPTAKSNQPWYTALWHTIADQPHGLAPAVVPPGPDGVTPSDVPPTTDGVVPPQAPPGG